MSTDSRTIDYGKIQRQSHPARRDANLRKLDDAELAAVKRHALTRRDTVRDSVKTEEIYRRISPSELRLRASQLPDGGAWVAMSARLGARADDYERRDAAGIGRHDFASLPLS